MEHLELRHGLASLTESDIQQWMSLFATCFECDETKAATVFDKYRLHKDDAWFCLGYSGTNLVACYSGIERQVGEHKVFLSTDTMSSGEIKNATAKLGTLLYGHLKECGVMAVCGFPNDKIVRIRERNLGWTMIGQLRLYAAPSLLWRWRWRASRLGQVLQWGLSRPPNGFFGKPLPLTQVLGRQDLYRRAPWLPLVLTAATRRPGPFFVELPHRLVPPKIFGFRALSADVVQVDKLMAEMAQHLDIQSIDVP
jgi:hypothetical protein